MTTDLQNEIQITPAELADWLKKDSPPRLIDVRGEDERKIATIEGDLPASKELIDQMIASWEKDTFIVTYCHAGIRSLDAAKYFISEGFTNVKSLTGGIDAWSQEIDSSIARY